MSTVDASLIVGLLEDELRKHHADPSPLRDLSETNVVDLNYRAGEEFAARYVAQRAMYALKRLRAVGPVSGDAVHDGMLVLGAHAHLCELRSAVKA